MHDFACGLFGCLQENKKCQYGTLLCPLLSPLPGAAVCDDENSQEKRGRLGEHRSQILAQALAFLIRWKLKKKLINKTSQNQFYYKL